MIEPREITDDDIRYIRIACRSGTQSTAEVRRET